MAWQPCAATTADEDSLFVCQCFADVEAEGDGGCLPLRFARMFIGKPYVAYTLEVNDDERLVVNTRQLDCTTLVENVAALTLCARMGRHTFGDFCQTLTTLRYREGVLDGYESRLHYFSQWIADKQAMGIVSEIQEPNPPFSAIQRIDLHYMSSHPDAYKALRAHPDLVGTIRALEQEMDGVTVRYIPKSRVGDSELLRSAVEDGDIIAITSGKDGLDIAHLGLAVWRDDGLHLLNASQIHKRVVEEPMTLYEYLQRHPTHTGIRIIRIN